MLLDETIIELFELISFLKGCSACFVINSKERGVLSNICI